MTTLFKPENFFESAMIFTVRIDTEKNGVESSGTGFLVQVLDRGKMALALISNRHVFQGGRGRIELRFHAATGRRGEFDLGNTVTLAGNDFAHRYVPHPDGGVDLAAAVVNAVGIEGAGMVLGEEHIATVADLTALSPGAPIWFVGYPEKWRDELHNLPLMRSGSVASLPRIPFDGRQEFVIDGQAFPGSSGSPVFGQWGNEMKLVGVLAETAQRESPVVGPPTVLGAFAVHEVLGLGLVIRSTEIPPLTAAVRTEVRRMIAEQGVP
jgi:hypothetical protein